MGRSGAVTFKGNPLTLAGSAVEAGQPAPDFTLHAFEDGQMNEIKPADLQGKPTISLSFHRKPMEINSFHWKTRIA